MTCDTTEVATPGLGTAGLDGHIKKKEKFSFENYT